MHTGRADSGAILTLAPDGPAAPIRRVPDTNDKVEFPIVTAVNDIQANALIYGPGNARSSA